MKKIIEGIISEQELVDIFGTSKQQQTYKQDGRFMSNLKTYVLRTARTYCDIEDLGDRRYKTSNIKQFPTNKTYEYLHSSMYQYICPQILELLINRKEHIKFTTGKWAREIDMVNDNYSAVKRRSEEAIRVVKPFNELGMTKNFIYDFYDHADNMVSNYITNALEYMKKMGLVIWQEVYMVVEQKVEKATIVNGDIDIGLSPAVVRRAQDEDLEFYSKCIGKADKKSNIQCDSERFYSSKAKHWKEELSRLLAKKSIQQVYKTYEVYATNYRKCNNFLDTYTDEERDNLVDKFTAAFSELINDNAKNRNDKNPKKYQKLIRDYVESYACITSFVIGVTDDNEIETELDYYANKSPMIENHKTTVTEMSK